MRNWIGGLPRLDNRKPNERWATGGEGQLCQDILRRLRELMARHDLAKVRLLRLEHAASVAELDDAVDDSMSLHELQAIEEKWRGVAAEVEARADELERAFASLSEGDKFKAVLDMLYEVRLAVLAARDQRGTFVRQEPSGSSSAAPQLLVPGQAGSRGASLGGISRPFGVTPPRQGGGVRRIG